METKMIVTNLVDGTSKELEVVNHEEEISIDSIDNNTIEEGIIISEDIESVVEDSHISENMTEEVSVSEIEHTIETTHSGPHITPIKASYISDGVSITTTTLTSILFLVLMTMFGLAAKRALKKGSGKLRTAVVSFVDYFYNFMVDSFDGDKEYAKHYFPLVAGFFVIILFGNLFGLVIDMLISAKIPIEGYLRPIFSDLSSTLPLALFVVLYSLFLAVKHNGSKKVLKQYIFNWTGNSIAEKAINVFVGWLHIVGLFSTVASLSLRLFGNIFAGIILISVLLYLGVLATGAIGGVGAFLTIPFWFFEIFVAFVQAAVFSMLMIAIFKQAHSSH